ncbi:H-NS histone family protein [Uliginosibacterium paludis]|uniref:H-NS histone family protein n=1 Tax=Uliginosibacterium paludis TaxID=1615952 RepID=A0ABV2CLW3_9RHOO
MLLTKSQLNKASEKDLNQAAEAIKAEIAKRETSSKEKAMKELKAVAAKHGISLESLLDGKSAKGAGKASKAPRAKKAVAKPRGKVAAKYANPADASMTWTGRGRKPIWVADALAAGKSLADLAIKG